MPLPKVKYPKYTLTVPSMNRTVSYRPFTVGEEKILITALQGGEETEIVLAIGECIESCFDDVKVSELTTYDVEYMFLNLRSKSVSNIIDMEFVNSACPNENGNQCKDIKLIKVDLDNSKVQKKNVDGVYEDFSGAPKNGTVIKLDSTLSVTMKHPSISILKELDLIENEEEKTNHVIISCICSVSDEESVYTDFTKEEMVEFYTSLLSEQKEKLAEFVENIPTLRFTTIYKCSKCGYTEEIEIEGLTNFFA